MRSQPERDRSTARDASGADGRYRLLLQVSKAANAQLDLTGLLEATASALGPLIEVDGIGVRAIDGDVVRPYAVYLHGMSHRPGDSLQQTVARFRGLSVDEVNDKFGVMPLAGSAVEQLARTLTPHVCEDLSRARESPEDERRFAFGVRSYLEAPLLVRDRLIGAVSFVWLHPRRISSTEIETLQDVSELLATAVANSMAYEKIRALKERLDAENVLLKEDIAQEAMFEEIVGSSKALRGLLSAIERVAPTDSTVLITGETGTGKELIARAIHRRSRRAGRALVKVNCAALPESLIASELFGHEKGAFTGALHRRLGRFEMAAGGSIFLDEVGDLPSDTQVALLRVLQEGEFERVGGGHTLTTDARVIAATNRDLESVIAAGRFRNDLFYRLNVFPIEAPPLRDRPEDIPLLVEYFAARYAGRMGKRIRRIDKTSRDRLVAYPWPGNVRELQNVIERAVILAERDTLVVDERMLRRPAARSDAARGRTRAAGAPVNQLREQEKALIEDALAQAHGRVSGTRGAAIRLGMPASTLESKIARFGIDKFRFRSTSRPPASEP